MIVWLHMINVVKQIHYWKGSAERNWQSAAVLFKNKHFDACLFFVHLTIEKLLKGLIVLQTQQLPPLLHDLVKLTRLAKLTPTKEQIEQLEMINTFNIAGRYDNEKFDFYKRCTPAFTKTNLEKSKRIYLWLKKEYQKK